MEGDSRLTYIHTQAALRALSFEPFEMLDQYQIWRRWDGKSLLLNVGKRFGHMLFMDEGKQIFMADLTKLSQNEIAKKIEYYTSTE